MKTKEKIHKNEVDSLLSSINNIDVKLQEACGPTVAIELRMRLIGQFSQSVRDKIKELIQDRKAKNPNSKMKHSEKYWGCKLCYLDHAIIDIFQHSISPNERKILLEFRDLRNSLLHADFISLMNSLSISPTGRWPNESKNILSSENIEEAIKSVDRNQGLSTITKKAREVIIILDNIIKSLAY